MTETAAAPRPLYEIADEITAKWRPVYYAAVPYVQAMRRLASLSDSYGYDDAEGIVIRFLGNARTWKGEDAKRIKAELRAQLDAFRKTRRARR